MASEPLEVYYASDTLRGLIRSGLTLLTARRVKPRENPEKQAFHLGEFVNLILYYVLIVTTASLLDLFQRIRQKITGRPRAHAYGSWQWYLETGLREDLGHFTNETVGYHENRPTAATEIDDLTAWVMAVIHFLWNYEDLMGAVWDEWTLLRLVAEAAEKAEMEYDEEFMRLQRQWEIQRPYFAPLNGTYADVRRAAFDDFIQPRIDALPPELAQEVRREHFALAERKRYVYMKQMSLLANMESGRFKDIKEEVELWDASIGVIVGGQYYLIKVIDHDSAGNPVAYGYTGKQWKLHHGEDGTLVTPIGDRLRVEAGQLYRKEDNELVGYIDMAPVSRVKWQVKQLLDEHQHRSTAHDPEAVDILLAETPRRFQNRLRKLLPKLSQVSVEELDKAPIIINWDMRPHDESLAELRRVQRGIGDHALTIMRTDASIVFDQSHAFFDGAWSLAIAEVLTNSAVRWCERSVTIAPAEGATVKHLELLPTPAFLKESRRHRQNPEISAETTIYDISSILALRRMLMQTGTRLTVNDLLVITRIFHAAHYNPSILVRSKIEDLQDQANSVNKSLLEAIDKSLQRGRVINPALLIPVDSSPSDPGERLFPITFRNLADSLVWIWDDTWDAYQEYRKIDPPNTPDGLAAFQAFALKRTLLIGNLRAFSYILDANKAVAIRGHSINVAIMNLLVGLPSWMQTILKEIPENFPALNEVIRGDEVYSNVGRVAKGSSLKRFMTAKDDGATKALAWGVMTDDDGRLIVTMRDFRPHVAPLLNAGRTDLARDLAQDYVVTYTADLIGLVARLSAMLQATSPELAVEE